MKRSLPKSLYFVTYVFIIFFWVMQHHHTNAKRDILYATKCLGY